MPDAPDARLEINAEIRFVSAINAFAEQFLAKVESVASQKDLLYSLQLVVSEACTNVIKHAYPPGKPGKVCLEIWIDDRRVTIQVTDYGSGFDPDSVPPPDLSEAHEGGYGLFLIKQSMDGFEYHSEPGKNVLRCFKEVKGA